MLHAPCASSGCSEWQGAHARQAKKVGWIGLVGYVFFSLWLVLIMGFSFVEAFILPRLATSDPSFVVGWMDAGRPYQEQFYLGALPTIWTLTAPIYIIGGVLFGVATFRGPRHLAAMGGRPPCHWDRIGPCSGSSSQCISAEDRYSGGASPSVVGLCALVGTTRSSLLTGLPERRRSDADLRHPSVETEPEIGVLDRDSGRRRSAPPGGIGCQPPPTSGAMSTTSESPSWQCWRHSLRLRGTRSPYALNGGS